jgi:hypothetical protein
LKQGTTGLLLNQGFGFLLGPNSFSKKENECLRY